VSGTGQPADAALAAELEALERALHAPQVRADRAPGALLDEDFSEIGSSGQCYGRAAALAEIPLERAQVLIESEQYAVWLLAAGPGPGALPQPPSPRWPAAALGAAQFAVAPAREGWRMVFHQGTPEAR
jgi:hypothetical protein